jgi:hypothetical protein
MSFPFSCPHCGQHFSAEREPWGIALTCHTCKKEFVTTNPNPAPPQPEPAPAGFSSASAALPPTAASVSGAFAAPEPAAGGEPKPNRKKKLRELRKAGQYLVLLGGELKGPFGIGVLHKMWRAQEISTVTLFTVPGGGTDQMEYLSEILDLIAGYKPGNQPAIVQPAALPPKKAGHLLAPWWPSSTTGSMALVLLLVWTVMPYLVRQEWPSGLRSLAVLYGVFVFLRYFGVVKWHNLRICKHHALSGTPLPVTLFTPTTNPGFYRIATLNAFAALVLFCFVTVVATRSLQWLQVFGSRPELGAEASAGDLTRLTVVQLLQGPGAILSGAAGGGVADAAERPWGTGGRASVQTSIVRARRMTLFSFGGCVLALAWSVHFRKSEARPAAGGPLPSALARA